MNQEQEIYDWKFPDLIVSTKKHLSCDEKVANMNSHPYYEAPEEDQGRSERTEDWNKSEIISFLDKQYDNPLNEFGADSYDELEAKIEEQGLAYEEDSDWRYEQVPDLGQSDYESESVFGIVPVEKADEVENPEPWEVKFRDETGVVQVHWENR